MNTYAVHLNHVHVPILGLDGLWVQLLKKEKSKETTKTVFECFIAFTHTHTFKKKEKKEKQ